MTIDPMNAPIFGDLAPADPPRPIRLATALLLGNVGLAAGYRIYTAIALDASLSLFLVPLVLAVWFALSLRAGRGWARTAATVLSCLSIAVAVWIVGSAVIDAGPDSWGGGATAAIDLIMMAVSVPTLVVAIRLMWRPEVCDYFSA